MLNRIRNKKNTIQCKLFFRISEKSDYVNKLDFAFYLRIHLDTIFHTTFQKLWLNITKKQILQKDLHPNVGQMLGDHFISINKTEWQFEQQNQPRVV